MPTIATIRRRTLTAIAALVVCGAVASPAAAQSPAPPPDMEFELPPSLSDAPAPMPPEAPAEPAGDAPAEVVPDETTLPPDAADDPVTTKKVAKRSCKGKPKKAKRRCKRQRSLKSGAAYDIRWNYGAVAYPQTGFRGCTNWEWTQTAWTYKCYWVNSYSSAPAGAHMIGWATENRFHSQAYYWNASERQLYNWYWFSWATSS